MFTEKFAMKNSTKQMVTTPEILGIKNMAGSWPNQGLLALSQTDGWLKTIFAQLEDSALTVTFELSNNKLYFGAEKMPDYSFDASDLKRNFDAPVF